MNQPYVTNRFPLDAIPKSLQKVFGELQSNAKTPPEMVIMSLLSVLSIACQSQIRVKMPLGTAVPVSLSTLIIAESGERKTYLYKMVMKAVLDFEKSASDLHVAEQIKYQAAKDIWELKHKVLMANLTKAYRKNKSTIDEEAAISAQMKLEPTLPKVPKLIYTDVTPEALAHGLSIWPSAMLTSDEASFVINGRAGRCLELLNKGSDGRNEANDRRSKKGYAASEINLTVAFMTQSGPLKTFLNSQGKDARSVGFLARLLVSAPVSIQGTRLINGVQDVNHKHQDEFNTRITALLKFGCDHINEKPETLELSPDATNCYVNFFNHVECNLAEGGLFCDIRDAGSKIGEMSVRLAALFHRFEGREGQIQVETYVCAQQICYWSLWEFKRIFGEKPEIPQEQVDAQILEYWLIQHLNRNPAYRSVAKNCIRQYGPNSLREKNRLNGALQELVTQGIIWIGHTNKTAIVNLAQAYQPKQRYAYPQAEIGTIGPNVHFTHQY
jgi:putative DNA primase/helicase